MAEQSTFIKIDRNILRWRWWNDHNTLIVFLYLLISANIVEHEFNQVIIRRGEVACSFSTIGQHAHLSIQQVRTAISHLKSTGEITCKSYSKFQVITIINYDKYQTKQHAKQRDGQHSINRQSTCCQQQYKNIKNEKKEKKEKGRSAPDSPSGIPERGTDEFRRMSHILLGKDEGTVDDIPFSYRDQFETFADYWGYKNQ